MSLGATASSGAAAAAGHDRPPPPNDPRSPDRELSTCVHGEAEDCTKCERFYTENQPHADGIMGRHKPNPSDEASSPQP